MVILKDLNGNVIGQQESQGYVSTRSLRSHREQELCDKQMGIDREAIRRENMERRQMRATRRLFRVNMARVDAGLEPIYDSPGSRSCSCEDYPCCGH